MKPSSIRYFIQEAFSGMKKNTLMCVGSVMAIAACIIFMSVGYWFVSNVNYILDQMEDSIGIAVFLQNDELSSEKIEDIKNQILQMDHVVSATYVSPDDALEELKLEWGADEDIFVGLDKENNPLSHSFKIELEALKYQDEVLNNLKAIPDIENMSYAKNETEILTKVGSICGVVSVVMMLLLALVSVLLITNTIKQSVYNRQMEIKIMKYVGATDWFVRWPFIIEGIIIGLIGSFIPVAIGWPTYAKLITMIYERIPLIRNLVQFRLSGDIYSVLAPASILFGVCLGVIGSVSSIRKYLKV